MPTTYQDCPKYVKDLCNAVMRKHHQHLVEGDVSIFLKFASNDGDVALMHGGYPAAATVRINNYEKRVEGLADATITIDEEWWNNAGEEKQEALLDHELEHLEVKRNKAGAIKYDDANRPCLKMRKHDFQIGGFNSIAKRHGRNAEEVAYVESVRAKWEQMELPFAMEK